MALITGIDEAGRGPVLGPLVICIAYCNRSDERQLKKLCKKIQNSLLQQSAQKHMLLSKDSAISKQSKSVQPKSTSAVPMGNPLMTLKPKEWQD